MFGINISFILGIVLLQVHHAFPISKWK